MWVSKEGGLTLCGKSGGYREGEGFSWPTRCPPPCWVLLVKEGGISDSFEKKQAHALRKGPVMEERSLQQGRGVH